MVISAGQREEPMWSAVIALSVCAIAVAVVVAVLYVAGVIDSSRDGITDF
jgi:hypothetical protein